MPTTSRFTTSSRNPNRTRSSRFIQSADIPTSQEATDPSRKSSMGTAIREISLRSDVFLDSSSRDEERPHAFYLRFKDVKQVPERGSAREQRAGL
jgi:hypothetical protein